MLTQQIEIEVEGARAIFRLRGDLAPMSVAAFWEGLPICSQLSQSTLAGDACFMHIHGGPLTQLPETPELGVASIYKGFMAFSASPGGGQVELLISYGQAEHRSATGRSYVTPLAEIEGDGTLFFDVLRRIQVEGKKMITIRRRDD